jgi:hypothetical protein
MSGLITKLLQVTHIQWIYRCILVYDCTTRTLISTHKEELLKEIDRPEGLAEEERFLLKCNFDNLTTTTGEHQEYWLLAIQAVRAASDICNKSPAAQHQRSNIKTKKQRRV